MTRPQDPVCPACGEPVGATSTYCMHCDAEFDAPIEKSAWTADGADPREAGEWGADTEPTPASDGGDSDQTVTEHPNGWDEGGPGEDGHTRGWSESEEATTSANASNSTTSAGDASTSTTPETTSDYGTTGEPTEGGAGSASTTGWTGRDLVQSLARISAVLLTVIVGILTTVTLMLLTVEVIEVWVPLVLVALVGIVTAGVVVARQDTGIDALADALYVTAAAVVTLPLVFFLFLPTGDPIRDRIVLGLIFSFMGAFVGVPLFVVGWWLQPDDEEIPWT